MDVFSLHDSCRIFIINHLINWHTVCLIRNKIIRKHGNECPDTRQKKLIDYPVRLVYFGTRNRQGPIRMDRRRMHEICHQAQPPDTQPATGGEENPSGHHGRLWGLPAIRPGYRCIGQAIRTLHRPADKPIYVRSFPGKHHRPEHFPSHIRRILAHSQVTVSPVEQKNQCAFLPNGGKRLGLRSA